MKSAQQIIIYWLLLVTPILGQDFHDRVRTRLAEIDSEEVENQINDLSEKTAAYLSLWRLSPTAILPFQDANDRCTGLTEFIATEFGKKLLTKKNINVLLADRVDEALKDQIDVKTIRLLQNGDITAKQLGVNSLIQGRAIVGDENIFLKVEVYDAGRNRIAQYYEATLPITAGLSKLANLTIDETKQGKTEAPSSTPQQMLSPVEKPKSELTPTPAIPIYTLQTNLEIAVRNLAEKLLAHLLETKKVKVGVLEFLDLQGRITQLGKFIGEDLTTAIFEKGKFTMVERGLLQQVMREHALTQTGIIDLSQAQEIGKAVGADAIITGSLSDIGNEIKANARLIDVGNGTLLAVAGESIAKTENVAKMFTTILWTPSGVVTPAPQPSIAVPVSSPSGYIFYEDFQNVPEGMLPQGWIGGEKLMVKSEGQQKYVTNFENEGMHRFTIDNLVFTENFEMEYLFRFGNDAFGTHQICSLGDVKITVDVFGWYQMNDSKTEKRQDFRNRTVKVMLRKIGPLFKLFINGEEMLLGRYPQFKTPQAITFEFQNMNGFRLFSIMLKAL